MCKSSGFLGLVAADEGKRPCGNCKSWHRDLMVEAAEETTAPAASISSPVFGFDTESSADYRSLPARATWSITLDAESGWAAVKVSADEQEVFDAALKYLKKGTGAWYDDRRKWWVTPRWIALRLQEVLLQAHAQCDAGDGKVFDPEPEREANADLRKLFAIIGAQRAEIKALRQEVERLAGQDMDLSRRIDVLAVGASWELSEDDRAWVRGEALEAARDFWDYRVQLTARVSAQRDIAKRIADAGIQGDEAKSAVDAAMRVRFPEPVKVPEGTRPVIDFDDLFKD